MRGHESTLENSSNDSLMPALGIYSFWVGGAIEAKKLKATYIELPSKCIFPVYFFAFLI